MIETGWTIWDARGGAYGVLRSLRRGGQGTTYRVREHATGEERIAKIFHPHFSGHPAVERRLEWLEAARLDDVCPALVGPRVRLHAGLGSGYVAQFRLGESLNEWLGASVTTLRDGLAIGAALAIGLDRLRALGASHGDISPNNVLVWRDSEGVLRVSWIDQDNLLEPRLPPPLMRGTPGYMAPEVLAEAPLSMKSDDWAFAAVLHELVLRRNPLAGRLAENAPLAEHAAALTNGGWFELPSFDAVLGTPTTVLDGTLQRRFARALGVEPARRPEPGKWVGPLQQALRDVWECSACEFQCINTPERGACPVCNRPPRPLVLRTNTGHAIPLDGSVTTIGRDDLAGDRSVSRVHATLERVGLEPRILDHSRCGSYLVTRAGLRRLPARRAVALRLGDRLRFGERVEALVSD